MDRIETKAVGRRASDSFLQIYLLGCVPFESVLSLQRNLLSRVERDRGQMALILCEHPPIVTVGRLGSRANISFERDELLQRGWAIRWINRGGGCLLHVPGQLAMYPIVALDRLGWNLRDYLDRLGQVVVELLRDFSVEGAIDPLSGNINVECRPIAMLGVSVRRWVTYHGAFLNVGPNLDLVRRVRSLAGAPPMTSLERERHGRIAMPRVRQRAIELISRQLGVEEQAIFFRHPAESGLPGSNPVEWRLAAQGEANR